MDIPHEVVVHTTQLKRFLLKSEIRQLSQFVVFIALGDNQHCFEIRNRGLLADLLQQFDLKPDVIDWLVSLPCESIESLAQCIADHNRTLLTDLTNP